jgi:hypothetical protein
MRWKPVRIRRSTNRPGAAFVVATNGSRLRYATTGRGARGAPARRPRVRGPPGVPAGLSTFQGSVRACSGGGSLIWRKAVRGRRKCDAWTIW